MIILSPSAQAAASSSHPPVSDEASKTEPYGEVPAHVNAVTSSAPPSHPMPPSGQPAPSSAQPVPPSRSAGLAVLVVGCFFLAGLVAVGSVLLVQAHHPKPAASAPAETPAAADAAMPEAPALPP
jgi:hypothetical protein